MQCIKSYNQYLGPQLVVFTRLVYRELADMATPQAVESALAEDIVREAMKDFRSQLEPGQLDSFRAASEMKVKIYILKTQNNQEGVKAMMDCSRIRLFLDAMSQFDEICITTNMGVQDMSAFIWGPSTYAFQVCPRDT